MHRRSGEDPVSILFNALEDLANTSPRMSRSILRSFYFLLFWLLFALLLWAGAVIRLRLVDIIVYMVLITIVIIVMIRLVELREKLATVVAQYQAYVHLRDMDIRIPEGRDEVERYLNYLDKTYDFSRRVEKRKGKVLRNAEIEGVKFALYAEIKRRAFDSWRGVKSYSFYLASIPEPGVKDIDRVVRAARKNSASKGLEIGRIVILAKSLSDEAYEHVLRQDLPVQVVMEMEDGTYDFIPFIGPRPDLLP